MSSLSDVKAELPPPHGFVPLDVPKRSRLTMKSTVALALVSALALATALRSCLHYHHVRLAPFYAYVVHNPATLCPAYYAEGHSYSGYIGLEGDTEKHPKRSFFWYFQAQKNFKDAPVILTMGGGPGSSGMINPLYGQSHCKMTENGTVPNENAWTENFNLVALDHPVGVGFSYGTHVNNSQAAALDVYDFLQKFFRLYPELAKNKLVVSGGSYGGVYVPNIATVILQQNLAIARGKGKPGAVHLNLEATLISNPVTDIIAWHRWYLYYRCDLHNLYNSTTCTELYGILPSCLSALEYATEISPSVSSRTAAVKICNPLQGGDLHGTVAEDIRRHCEYENDDESIHCSIPEIDLFNDFFADPEVKKGLGVPEHVHFSTFTEKIAEEFDAYGDIVTRAHRLYEPLLAAGIRSLHYIGAQDANCAWPATLSFLEMIRSPFQDEFRSAPDVPWDGHNATVRAIGPGAGNQTFILIQGAGHFVVKDQTALVKEIVDHFVQNIPFV